MIENKNETKEQQQQQINCENIPQQITQSNNVNNFHMHSKIKGSVEFKAVGSDLYQSTGWLQSW